MDVSQRDAIPTETIRGENVNKEKDEVEHNASNTRLPKPFRAVFAKQQGSYANVFASCKTLSADPSSIAEKLTKGRSHSLSFLST